jgi:hypothetical protein
VAKNLPRRYTAGSGTRRSDVFERSDIDLLVERSMAGSGLLDELVCGMRSTDDALAWDCTELLRRVAQSSCGLVQPYRGVLEAGTHHPSEHVRLEAEAALEADRRCGSDAREARGVLVGTDGEEQRRAKWRRTVQHVPRGRRLSV